MTDRERLIELIRKAKKNTKGASCDLEREMLFADFLLENGVIVPPCKVGDTVYIILIDSHKEDNSPIFKIKTGTVFSISIDNTREETIWVGASFGVLHCCRPHTDFCYSIEEAEKALSELNKGE